MYNVHRYFLPLLGLVCSLTLSLSPAHSQGAPGEVGQNFQAVDPGETGPNGLKLAEIGEAGPIFQLTAEPGETGEMDFYQLAQIDPGESGPPPALKR